MNANQNELLAHGPYNDVKAALRANLPEAVARQAVFLLATATSHGCMGKFSVAANVYRVGSSFRVNVSWMNDNVIALPHGTALIGPRGGVTK